MALRLLPIISLSLSKSQDCHVIIAQPDCTFGSRLNLVRAFCAPAFPHYSKLLVEN